MKSQITPNDMKYSDFGRWELDAYGLPCFEADLESHPIPYNSFPHLMSTGHVCLLTDQWGNINILIT